MTGTTTLELLKMKGNRKIAMVTCYDATFARVVAMSGVDMVLVGDSMGMVIQGHDSTLPVTVDDIIYHGGAVWRGFNAAAASYGGGDAKAATSPAPKPPHLTLDMPFMSFQESPAKALANAGRMMKEGHAESVKVEGGSPEVLRAIRRMVEAGIPVMGHLGLTPQSVHALGGFKVQGREEKRAREIVAEAKALEAEGCYAVVLEAIPTPLAGEITAALRIPTIGIGAGPLCDGQVLVIYDLLGMNTAFAPKFVKRYASLEETMRQAVSSYADEVRGGSFPDDAHSFAAVPAKRGA